MPDRTLRNPIIRNALLSWGFTPRRCTQVCGRTPIVRIVELGLHSIMQGPHGFIDPTPLHPCLDVPTHSHAEEGIMGNADHLQSDSPSSTPYVVHVPLPQRAEVLGLYLLLSPYCPCTTRSFKSENLYKPIYFETADYGRPHPKEPHHP